MAAMAVQQPPTEGGSGIGNGTTSSSTSTGADQQQDDRLRMPSRNPLPLSATQEAQIRDIYYARVRSYCTEEIKAFAECAGGRTFSAPFACRGPLRVMNGCMKGHATPSEQDKAREDWFAQRMERQRERERKARRKAEQEVFLREWWGLPEKDREAAQREMDKLAQKERIGGMASANRIPPGQRGRDGER